MDVGKRKRDIVPSNAKWWSAHHQKGQYPDSELSMIAQMDPPEDRPNGPTRLHTPPYGYARGFATDLLAGLWSSGTFTNWATVANFLKAPPFIPEVPGLSWRELCGIAVPVGASVRRRKSHDQKLGFRERMNKICHIYPKFYCSAIP